MTPRGRCVTPSLLPAMCVYGMGLPNVQVPPSHHPSCLAAPSPRSVMHCAAVRVSGMLCPPSSQVMESRHPCALLPGLLVGWLPVFGLIGWLFR